MEKGLQFYSDYEVSIDENRNFILTLAMSTGFETVDIPIKLRNERLHDEEVFISRFDMVDMKSILTDIKLLKLRVFNDSKVKSVKVVNGKPRITIYDGEDCYTALPEKVLSRHISLEEFKSGEFNTIEMSDGNKYYSCKYNIEPRRAFIDTEDIIYEVTGKEEEELLEDIFKDSPYCSIFGTTLKIEYRSRVVIKCDCDHFDESGKSTLIKDKRGKIKCTQCNGYLRDKFRMAYYKD